LKVLITGAGGQLGRELQASAPAEVELHALDRARLDITRAEKVEEIVGELRPDLVINAAAYTAVDRAEEERDQAFAVNADGARCLAAATARRRARLIHVSTDFVFDGAASRPYLPGAAANPQGIYGASKREGEVGVSAATEGKALILRTAWVYSRFGSNFVRTMLRLLAEREELGVVDDQIGSPTWAKGLAIAIWSAARRPAWQGCHHWTDAGVASWYDFAVAIQEEGTALGLLRSSCRVQPISTADFPTAARRPPYSVLDKAATWTELGVVPTHWRRQLRFMLQEVGNHGDG
jgi:dTDP-4-dehydrorhamnose reductase